MISVLLVMLAEAILQAAPLILAAMGGWLSERSGVMNIALEGKMLTAACVSAWIGGATGSVWLGIGAGIVAAIAVSCLHWLLTQTYRFDHIISGMAINAIALGLTGFLAARYLEAGPPMPAIPTLSIQLTANYRWFINPLVGLALILPFFLAWVAARTRFGLRLLAVGSDPDKARMMGILPKRVRLASLLGTGVCTGLAGSLFVVSASGRFNDNTTAGRGYIALAALILGGWRPIPTLVACLAFAMATSLQVAFQGKPIFGFDVPSEFWQSLPYLATVVALAGFLGKGSRPPAGMGQP